MAAKTEMQGIKFSDIELIAAVTFISCAHMGKMIEYYTRIQKNIFLKLRLLK